MLRKLFCSLTCACLCIGFSVCWAAPGTSAPDLGSTECGLAESGVAVQDTRQQVAVSSRLKAALCEMAVWESFSRAEIDSLLLLKASYLREAGEAEDAYATLCRVQRFGLTEEQRADLLRRKLICTWEAGLMDEFRGLLDEARSEVLAPLEGESAAAAQAAPVALSATPVALSATAALTQAVAVASTLSGRSSRRNPDVAMLLSVIPGAGLAYAGDWSNAGKYFLLQGGSIVLGVGAYLSGLYVSAFLGGGMLLYTTLPVATAKAIEAANEFNARSLKAFYAPVAERLMD